MRNESDEYLASLRQEWLHHPVSKAILSNLHIERNKLLKEAENLAVANDTDYLQVKLVQARVLRLVIDSIESE